MPNLLPAPETLGNWADGRISCWHSAPTSFLVLNNIMRVNYSPQNILCELNVIYFSYKIKQTEITDKKSVSQRMKFIFLFHFRSPACYTGCHYHCQCSFPRRKRTATLRIWRAREREPIMGVWGLCPQRGYWGRAPGQGVQGGFAPLELKAF